MKRKSLVKSAAPASSPVPTQPLAAALENPPVVRILGSYRYNKYVRARFSQNPALNGKFLSFHVRIRIEGAPLIALYLDFGMYKEARDLIVGAVDALPDDSLVGVLERQTLRAIADALVRWSKSPVSAVYGLWIIEAGYDFGGTIDGKQAQEGQVMDIWIYLPDAAAVVKANAGAGDKNTEVGAEIDKVLADLLEKGP